MTSTIRAIFVAGLFALAPRAHAAPPSAPVPSTCNGVSDPERYVRLLSNRQNVVAVGEIKPDDFLLGDSSPDPRSGARVRVAAEPGVTAEWLQRLAECHIAQNAARGYPQSAVPSPLDVKGAAVQVSSVGDGFAVDVTSYDWKAGREILRRARALLIPPTAP
jgi:hypothetical protein